MVFIWLFNEMTSDDFIHRRFHFQLRQLCLSSCMQPQQYIFSINLSITHGLHHIEEFNYVHVKGVDAPERNTRPVPAAAYCHAE